MSGLQIVLTGIGPRNARRTLETLLETQTPSRVISSGFAGGLDPDLLSGDLVHAGFTDAGCRTRLAGLGAREARFLTVERIAVSVAEKRSLRQASGADAVEMESGTIQAVCADRQVPCAILRVISDPANEPLPLDFNALLTADQRLDPAKMARALLRSPGRLPVLLSFHFRVRRAAGRLAMALEQVIAGGQVRV